MWACHIAIATPSWIPASLVFPFRTTLHHQLFYFQPDFWRSASHKDIKTLTMALCWLTASMNTNWHSSFPYCLHGSIESTEGKTQEWWSLSQRLTRPGGKTGGGLQADRLGHSKELTLSQSKKVCKITAVYRTRRTRCLWECFSTPLQ